MSNLDGVIIKGIGGFYYVNTESGLIECRARGVFRKRGDTPLVGDNVVIETSDSSHGVISEIKERKNALIRPAVANVTQMAVVVAQSSPSPNPYILDKLIASAEFVGLEIAVCFNKADLGGDDTLIETYKKAGFDVIITSAVLKCLHLRYCVFLFCRKKGEPWRSPRNNSLYSRVAEWHHALSSMGVTLLYAAECRMAYSAFFCEGNSKIFTLCGGMDYRIDCRTACYFF